jgi:hypothetical protein
MNALRNVSGQSFVIQRAGGSVAHLFPGRALALTDEELRSAQVQSLIVNGLARVQRIVPPTARAAKADTAQPGSERGEGPERRPEKKKVEP